MNSNKTPLVSGNQPAEWEKLLNTSLLSDDRAGLEKTLISLRAEMMLEVESLRSLDRGPTLSRLIEQARRLFQIAPTDFEALRSELDEERSIWAQYRLKYRSSFVPSILHPYLKNCALFLKSSPNAPQFPNFNKFFSQTPEPNEKPRLEAITLFSPIEESPTGSQTEITPPNFLSEFHKPHGIFTVKRAYRTVLPKGAGTDCILEHIQTLVPRKKDLKWIVFDNVKNSKTYDIFVQRDEGSVTLNPRPAEHQAPLVKLAARILAELHLKTATAVPRLDRLGFLDLCFQVTV